MRGLLEVQLKGLSRIWPSKQKDFVLLLNGDLTRCIKWLRESGVVGGESDPVDGGDHRLKAL